MKHFIVFCYMSVIILGFLTTISQSFFFPYYLISVVLLMPATPVLNTPSYSWAVFLLGVGTLVLSAYIGYPRNPTLKPLIRRKLRPLRKGRSADYTHNILFEMIAEMETKNCFSRYLCHIATMDPAKMTIFQKSMINFVSSQDQKPSNFNFALPSTKTAYMEAVYFGETSQCSDCCQNLYPTCDLPTNELILI
ncbi:hypothetical protein CHUAL_010621 [Chamberlinius hualienensis]